MWDNALLLKNIANALIAFSALAALYGAVYYAVHLPGLFPLQSVRLSAPLQRVAAAEVLRTVRNEANGNFFTVDIEHVRQSLEKLPWVRSIGIRREFPHGLLVDMEEHQALARWNGAARHDEFGTSLVNQYGEVFFVGAGWIVGNGQELPDFNGPEGSSAEVAQHYMQFSRQITPLNLQTVQLALSARHAWQMRLNNGMVLELGREDMQQRLARFVAVQRTEDITSDLAGVFGQPSRMASSSIRGQRTEGAVHVDLRYRNGFAVRQVTNVKG